MWVIVVCSGDSAGPSSRGLLRLVSHLWTSARSPLTNRNPIVGCRSGKRPDVRGVAVVEGLCPPLEMLVENRQSEVGEQR
jgi:hypothetical protein